MPIRWVWGEDVVEAFNTLKEDDDVRVIVLTGAGKGFCAGVDLDHLKEQFAAAEKGEEIKGPKLGEERFNSRTPCHLGHLSQAGDCSD